MAVPTKGIFIVGAKRTPFCRYGGSLRETPASHVFAAAAKGAIHSANLDPSIIDNTIVGNVNFLSQCDGGKTPRYCGLYSGVPIEKPALGVNKACGTGLQAIINGALEIWTGLANVSLTGGTELMSSLPQIVRNVRFGTSLGSSYQLEDYIKKQFLDSYTGLTLQGAAEQLAKKYGIKREDADGYTLESYAKWKSAQDSIAFGEEITNLTVNLKKKEIQVNKDELPQQPINAEYLSALPAVLDDGSIVTSGNSAAPADGAAAVLIANEETIKRHQLKPLARIAAWSCVGVDPLETGLGAIPAVRRLNAVADLNVDQVDLFEINDIFATQTLITAQLLDIDPNKLNTNGGAITLGHPVAASGARMAVHLVHEMSRSKLRRAVAASSCGGGQGVAILFEAP